MPQIVESPSTKAPAQRGLSREKLEAIADERTRCEGLSLREFAQRLFERRIYRTTARDGSAVPVNAGTLGRWLELARDASVL